ncbi:MAG: hypothetical protein FWD22_04680 [Treponema sp.]|nr:hypothetical protein [Treponema sp.]
MKSIKECNAAVLALVLRDYFPGLIFIPKNNTGNLGILNYIVEKSGKWTLDINAMSRSKEKHFSCLFPKDISSWDEEKARKIFGSADVVKYFVDAENDKFLHEFSRVYNDSISEENSAVRRAIPENFFDALDGMSENYDGKRVWEDWDFSGLILHKLRHDPPSVYEAFDYYGHRNYTLLGFGLEKSGSGKNIIAELLKTGRKNLDDTVRVEFPEMSKAAIERQISFFELIQEILEGTPSGQSIYVPTEMEVFIKQLKSRSYGLNKKTNDIDSSETYNSSERKTIKNHIIKIGKFLTEDKDKFDLNRTKLEGTYREKINLLHRLVMKPSVSENYSRRELDMIHGLFLKQFYNVSLDNQLSDGDEKDSYTGHDIVEDEKYLQPDSRFMWMSFFKDIFEKEFDDKNLEKFLECLPDHFSQYPLQVSSDGEYKMSKYSRQMLFSTFCSVSGIAEDKELWKPFLVLLQQVIGNINRSLT